MLARLLRFFSTRSATVVPVTEIIELVTPEDRAHQLLDVNAIAREHEGKTLGLDERLRVLLHIIESGTRQLVDDRQTLVTAVNDSLTLLRGAPGASDLRIRRAIATLELRATHVRATPATEASDGRHDAYRH